MQEKSRNWATKKQQGANVQKKVYLVYDYEEFCGAYSSLSIAKKAVKKHLGAVMDLASSQAAKLELGDLQLEVTEDSGKKRWTYLASFKTASDGQDLHCRRPTIFECPIDEYDSVTKRLLESRRK